jgi:predicted ribosomally synthesized peptide with nif11-like leader
MSLESARACVERIGIDESFRRLLENTFSKTERYQVAQSEGMCFTKEEWDFVVAEDRLAPQVFGSIGRAACYFPGECRA